RRMRTALTSTDVKRKAKELGADLCNIASGAALEAHPPDPEWPQVPSRISTRMKTVILTAIRMPWGIFLTDNQPCLSIAAQLLLRKTERVSLALSYWLEEQGYHAFQVATEETDPRLKRGSYGWLSLRHVGVEAGLAPDPPITEQLCIGETCGRCLYSCPTDAVLHWGLDKRACGRAAQPDGIASVVYGPLRRLAEARDADDVRRVFDSRDTQDKWSAIVRLATSYAACPRCLEVCPVGWDYLQFL